MNVVSIISRSRSITRKSRSKKITWSGIYFIQMRTRYTLFSKYYNKKTWSQLVGFSTHAWLFLSRADDFPIEIEMNVWLLYIF